MSMSNLQKSNYWFSSGYLLLFFFIWSLWYSFFSIWLNKELNLSGAETGFIYSINSFMGLIFMPFYGVIQDKIGIKKHLIWIQSVVLMGIGPFFIYFYEPLLQSNFYVGAVIGSIYLGGGFIAGVGFLESYIEKISRKYNFEYGQTRMWGSIGFAIATFLVGILININPNINFWLASLAGVIFFIMNFFFKVEMDDVEIKHTKELNSKDILKILKLPKFWFFLLYALGISCIYEVFEQQFPVYFSDQFATNEQGNRIFGYLNSFQVFMEAGMMFLAPFIVNKLGAKKSLILAGIITGIIISGSGLVDGPVGVSTVKLLAAVQLPIMIVAVFKYIGLNFDTRLSSTIYLAGYKFSREIGIVLISSFAGSMYDRLNFETSYLILGAVVFVVTFISVFTLSEQKNLNKTLSNGLQNKI